MFVCASLLALLGMARPCLALTPEEEATATRLMREGIRARESGELEAAERAFEAAHALANLPSSGIALAKVLIQRGRLLQAMRVVNGVLRLEQTAAWTSASVNGYAEAVALAPELEKRIPSITVEVDGGDDSSVRVRVDGAQLRPPVLGVPRQLDPGPRRVEVERDGYETYTTKVELVEGMAGVVRAVLTPKPDTTGPVAPEAIATPTRGGSPDRSDDSGRPLLVAGVVVGAVGLAGLGAAVITGSIAKSKESDLEPSCPGGVCPPDRADELSSAKGFSTAANVLFAAGGVLGAAGLTMIVIDLSSNEPRRPAAASLRLGPGFVGIDGRF